MRYSKFVEKLKEYETTPQTCWLMPDKSMVVKADWNESPVPPSPKVRQALIDFISGAPLHWYPDIDATQLRQALVNYTGLDFDYIQVFNGSDNALEYVTRVYLNEGEEVIIRVPTYNNFRVFVESCGGQVKNVLFSSPFVFEIQPILDEITDQTKLVYLVNPNNPTGAIASQQEVRELLTQAPEVTFIVDEAYYEYYGETMADLVKEFPNLLIIRTFSKAFSIAGLRCGYILTQPQNIRAINKIRVGKNVNSLAQIAALATLEDLGYSMQFVKEVNEVKEWMVQDLNERGFETRITPANYVLIKVPDPGGLIAYLKSQHVYIRDRSTQPQLENYVRVTVGTRDQMEKVIDLITDFHRQ